MDWKKYQFMQPLFTFISLTELKFKAKTMKFKLLLIVIIIAFLIGVIVKSAAAQFSCAGI